jgi:hypothetical protein
VLAWGSRRENRLVHIRRDLMVAMKDDKAVCDLQTKLRFLYWKSDADRSLYINALICHLHHFTPIIR